MKKSVKILGIIGIILLTLLLLSIVGMSIFTGQSMLDGAMKMFSNEDTKENSLNYLKNDGFDIEKDFAAYVDNIKKVTIPSSKHQHTIPADYITVNGSEDNNTVILVHGLGGDRRTTYPIAKMFLEHGFNIVAYDQRNSGDNLAEYNTFGYLESDDLEDCVDFVRTKVSPDKRVGVLGISMGGATAGFYSGKQHASDNIDFVILDSPISNMEYMIETGTSEMDIGIPLSYLMFCGNWATKIKLGFFYKDMNVPKTVAGSTVPTLIIYSKEDDVTPYFMAEDIYNAIPHNKKYLYTLENGKHATAFDIDKSKYTKEVMNFID